MSQFENWGDYFWPDQIDDCRINKLGIHDATKLEDAERSRTAERAVELIAGDVEIPQTFDLEHLKAIHQHLFQDVYDWAGELRTTELVRPSTDPNAPGHEFVKPEDIERLAPIITAELGDPHDLRDRPTEEVVDVLARTYAAVNVLHPFHEGNGRTQRIFLDHVAEAAGHQIDWSRIADRQNEVMAEAFTTGPEPVRQALADCVERIPPDDALRTTLRVAQDGVAKPTASGQRTPGRSGGRRGPAQNPTRQRERERRR